MNTAMSKLNSKTIQLPADAHCIEVDLKMSNDDSTVIKYKLTSTGDKLHFHIIKGVFSIDNILAVYEDEDDSSFMDLPKQVSTEVCVFEMWSYKDLVDKINGII